MHFNTAVSSLMQYINFLNTSENTLRMQATEHTALRARTARYLVLMLAPFVPHMAEEIWHELGEEGSVHIAAWPEYDPQLVKDDVVTIVVQINGRVRTQLAMAADATEAEVTEAAKADPKAAAYLDSATVVKTVFVPGKLINYVVK